MVKALGADSLALGFAGGRGGELLQDGLHALGSATDFVWVPGETRTNVSVVSQNHDHYLKANEPGPTISTEKQQELAGKIRSLAKTGDLWVLAGCKLGPANILVSLGKAGALLLDDQQAWVA